MKKKRLTEVIDFYYSLSAAIKISRRYGDIRTTEQHNYFIVEWLQKIRAKKRSNPHILKEIDWLTEHVQARGPLFPYAELLIDNVYITCIKYLKGNPSLRSV